MGIEEKLDPHSPTLATEEGDRRALTPVPKRTNSKSSNSFITSSNDLLRIIEDFI